VTLASREVPVMVGLRLFLPETWTNDPDRMTRVGVPKDRQVALTKPEIAIQEIDRVVASGARFGCVLADAGYGSSGTFRQALSERGLRWAVGLSRRQNVYPADVALIFPKAKTGKQRQYHIPDKAPVSAETVLAGERWQTINWRRGTRGRLTCRFAARRIRVADGHKHRTRDNRMQCMPGDEVWLVGERRPSGEQKYYLSNLPPETPLRKLAATIKARWICEQAHQQLKEELGLDHFEGRSLDRAPSTRLDDDDGLRLPSNPPLQGKGGGKKIVGGRRHNRACRPSGEPYLTSSRGHHHCDARIVRSSSHAPAETDLPK
jgi:SRSO17 transposase